MPQRKTTLYKCAGRRNLWDPFDMEDSVTVQWVLSLIAHGGRWNALSVG